MTNNFSDTESPVFDEPLYIVRPTFPPLADFQDDFAVALESGQVTNNGPWVRRFEERLTELLGVPTLVFSSGQAALLTMLRAADLTSGEVITPSLTFAATPHAIAWSGATPVFADALDDLSFGVDPADVERRITPQTRAIVAMCPYGIPCDYAALEDLAKRHGLPLLIDSAAAFGARVDGQLVGGRGDAQIFSFHATKSFTTMEGGALSSNDPKLMEAAIAIRNFGLIGTEATHLGFNGKMLEVCAMIGMAQLDKLEPDAANRRACVARLREGLLAIDGLRVGTAPAGVDPIWLYLPVMIDAERFGIDRDAAADALAKQNLMVRKYYSPACHEMPVYNALATTALPVSERIASQVIALPIYNNMAMHECDGIIECFRRIFGK